MILYVILPCLITATLRTDEDDKSIYYSPIASEIAYPKGAWHQINPFAYTFSADPFI